MHVWSTHHLCVASCEAHTPLHPTTIMLFNLRFQRTIAVPFTENKLACVLAFLAENMKDMDVRSFIKGSEAVKSRHHYSLIILQQSSSEIVWKLPSITVISLANHGLWALIILLALFSTFPLAFLFTGLAMKEHLLGRPHPFSLASTPTDQSKAIPK